MQNWALTQAPGTPEARPQRPKRRRGAQGQPNPDTQKQMLLILSRLALKHDLEIRELQAATFRTMLVKHDEPLVQASKAVTGLFVTKSKEGQRPTGEPHVYGWAAMMTALTTDPALSSEDKQKVAAYTSSANSPETLLQTIYGASCGPPDSAHLVRHHQSHESEGAKEKFGANSNKYSTIFYASWRKERRTATADFLATTNDAKYCTDECRRQQRRTAVVDLLDATKVISSPRQCMLHQLLSWNASFQLQPLLITRQLLWLSTSLPLQW